MQRCHFYRLLALAIFCGSSTDGASLWAAPQFSSCGGAFAEVTYGSADWSKLRDSEARRMGVEAKMLPFPGIYDIIENPDLPLVISRTEKTRTIEAFGAQRIHLGNIADIFTHQYNPNDRNAYGAKALGGRFAYDSFAVFWQTGRGGDGINVHHRDAVAQIYRWQAVQGIRGDLFIERMYRELPNIFHDPALLREATLTYEDLITAPGGVFSASNSELLSIAVALSEVRNQSSLRRNDLSRMVGIQMTARPNDKGQLMITDFDVDSSLFAASAHKEHSRADWAQLIATVHNAIDPAVRQYRFISISGSKRDFPPELLRLLRELTGLQVQFKSP